MKKIVINALFLMVFLVAGQTAHAQSDSAMTKELYLLKDKLASWVYLKVSKLTPHINVLRSYDSEPEYGMIWEKNTFTGTGGQEMSQYYGEAKEVFYMAKWGKVNTNFESSSLSYEAPLKKLCFSTYDNGSESIIEIRNGSNYSQTRFDFSEGKVIVRGDYEVREHLTKKSFTLLKDSLTSFLARNNPKPAPKDDTESNNKVMNYLKDLRVSNTPNILGPFDYFNLPENDHFWRSSSWAAALQTGVHVLGETKEPERVLFMELANAYTGAEQKKFNRDCNMKLATEAGRISVYNWILPYIKPLTSFSTELASKISSLLHYLSDFNYQSEKDYYQKCIVEKREDDFVSINPKTGELERNRWWVSWVFRRVREGIFDSNTVHVYAKKAIKDLGLDREI